MSTSPKNSGCVVLELVAGKPEFSWTTKVSIILYFVRRKRHWPITRSGVSWCELCDGNDWFSNQQRHAHFWKMAKGFEKRPKNSKNNFPIWCVSWCELCDGNDWFCNQRRHVYIFLKNGQKFRKKAQKIAKIITRSGVFPGVNSVTVMIGFATSGGICFFPIPPPWYCVFDAIEVCRCVKSLLFGFRTP